MSPRKEQKEQSQRLPAHTRTGQTTGRGCGGRQPGRQQAGNGRASASGAVSQRCSAEHVSWAVLGHRAHSVSHGFQRSVLQGSLAGACAPALSPGHSDGLTRLQGPHRAVATVSLGHGDGLTGLR